MFQAQNETGDVTCQTPLSIRITPHDGREMCENNGTLEEQVSQEQDLPTPVWRDFNVGNQLVIYNQEGNPASAMSYKNFMSEFNPQLELLVSW